MARRTPRFPTTWTFADLSEHLGGIPVQRIRMYPTPGTATERDVIAIQDHENRSCELIEGVLVEKAMGYRESLLAGVLLHWISAFLDENDLGALLNLVPGIQATLRAVKESMSEGGSDTAAVEIDDTPALATGEDHAPVEGIAALPIEQAETA